VALPPVAYSKPSLIRNNCGAIIRISEAKCSPERKNLEQKLIEKLNDISSANEDK
jgi:hypothetical protein